MSRGQRQNLACTAHSVRRGRAGQVRVPKQVRMNCKRWLVGMRQGRTERWYLLGWQHARRVIQHRRTHGHRLTCFEAQLSTLVRLPLKSGSRALDWHLVNSLTWIELISFLALEREMCEAAKRCLRALA